MNRGIESEVWQLDVHESGGGRDGKFVVECERVAGILRRCRFLDC